MSSNNRGFDSSEIEVPRALHTKGLDALKSAASVCTATRARLAEAELDLRALSRRLLTERNLNAPELEAVIRVLSGAANELLLKRQELEISWREFRACDQDLTPTRPNSDPAFVAYQVSSNFPPKK